VKKKIALLKKGRGTASKVEEEIAWEERGSYIADGKARALCRDEKQGRHISTKKLEN